MNSLMISKYEVESHSLKITNDALSNPKFYTLLNNWVLDASNGNVNLNSYCTYKDFCSYFSLNTTDVKNVTKHIQKSTSDGYVAVGIYRTADGITVYVRNYTEELEIVEEKSK